MYVRRSITSLLVKKHCHFATILIPLFLRISISILISIVLHFYISSTSLPRYYMIAEYYIEGEDNFIDRLTAIERYAAHAVGDNNAAVDSGCGKSYPDIIDDDNDEERGYGGRGEDSNNDDDGDDDVEGNGDEDLRREFDGEIDKKIDHEIDEKLNETDYSITEEEVEGKKGVGEEEEEEEEKGEEEEEEGEVVYHNLPLHISQHYPSIPQAIGDFILNPGILSPESLEFLTLPHTALSAYWAAKRLSIVGKFDRRSYCFTHSYGRLYDKSSGSVFWEVRFTVIFIIILVILFVSAF